jgi:hypothetical protein
VADWSWDRLAVVALGASDATDADSRWAQVAVSVETRFADRQGGCHPTSALLSYDKSLVACDYGLSEVERSDRHRRQTRSRRIEHRSFRSRNSPGSAGVVARLRATAKSTVIAPEPIRRVIAETRVVRNSDSHIPSPRPAITPVHTDALSAPRRSTRIPARTLPSRHPSSTTSDCFTRVAFEEGRARRRGVMMVLDLSVGCGARAVPTTGVGRDLAAPDDLGVGLPLPDGVRRSR